MPTSNVLKLALLCTIVIGLYLIRYVIVRPGYQAGDTVRVIGRITNHPQIFEDRQKLDIAGLSIYLERFPEFGYGERIKAEGIIAKGKGGNYLKGAKVEKLAEKNFFAGISKNILSLYQKTLPQPHAGLAAGVILGTKSSLENSFWEDLQETGTLHVVVASGSNIAFFSGMLANFSAFFWGRKRAILIMFVLIWLYVVLIGAQPPIVRAAIMGTVVFLAQSLGKEADSWRALFASGVVMLLVNPLWLFDLGFQLSFLATVGILASYRRILPFVQRVKVLPRVSQEALAMTFGAQVAVSPLLYATFGNLSLVSPLVNTLVLPVVPLIMSGGFVVAIFGLAWEPLGQVAAWFLWLPLEYFVQVTRLFANLAN